MKKFYLSLLGGISFAFWSLRRRTGQTLPVTVSFLLLISSAQSIGALHVISSQLLRQQIARSWRGQYDLLIRPQSAVSEPERNAGWVDPQSILETYGGISQRQVASIGTIAHVAQVVPVATVGWQPVNVLLPVELVEKGIFRITVGWNGQQNEIVRYVEVSELAYLTKEPPMAELDVQHVVVAGKAKPVNFTISVQGIQAMIGIPASQQEILSQVLLENLTASPAIHLSLRVERLRGELSSFAGCVDRPDCWEAQQVRQGIIGYQNDGVQLLRYSRTRFIASSQQVATGEITILASGSDSQGLLYRALLPEDVSIPIPANNIFFGKPIQYPLLSFSMPQRLPFFTGAVHFIPLEQACAINGDSCYSGLYVRLSGVERYNQQSLTLLQSIAASIIARTGLHVDILDGSSLRTVTISAQSPVLMQTSKSMQSTWREVGIAVQIEHGMDTLQTALLVLCSFVCLLSIGVAGVLVGIGRRKEALLLRQVGWRWYVLVAAFISDGLALCGPGSLLAIGWTIFATRTWTSSLSPMFTWVLLVMGVLLYCFLLVSVACSGSWRSSSSAHRAKSIAKYISGVALASTVFLIAVGYMLISGFNRELVVTLLGRQVSAALESSQLVLLLIFLSASLLTVNLCSKLLLVARREELQLLAMVGWDRPAVMLRIMWDYCSPALVYGAIGVLLAMALAALFTAFPTILMALSLLVCGPALGALLAGLATISNAWQETGRVYR
jgi:hypothetical protein